MKRSDMVAKIVAVMSETSNCPFDVVARSILAMQSEAGMLPPDYNDKKHGREGDYNNFPNQWEPENETQRNS